MKKLKMPEISWKKYKIRRMKLKLVQKKVKQAIKMFCKAKSN